MGIMDTHSTSAIIMMLMAFLPPFRLNREMLALLPVTVV